MPLRSQPNAQPVSVRLALTLSLALLLHTLILAVVVHWLRKQPDPPPATLHFTLLDPGDTPSQTSNPSASAASESTSSPGNPPESFRETLEPVVTRRDDQPRAETRTKPATATHQEPTARSPSPTSTQANLSQPSTPSPNSVASRNGGASTSREIPEPVTPDDRTTQIPRQPSEQDPYVALLWQHISEELDHRPVRSIHELKRVRTVRLELHLMDNGTLRQVDTIESSGKRELDSAAVQSALAASPYPEPPESARERGFRFQVELRFSPRNP
ncbi:energy transducer TonB [Marinobacter halodurans]|uniref:Energy transducer TonB n=1 Tax=Marinobacter halodurans TaxID=2528979 RepID=A0ABY1ZPZ3_9GAMM|nr:energy transducer TonB [Marinobacter halodurans]TBW57833.1 energy transducer TonB [Marinobacter halodurans]